MEEGAKVQIGYRLNGDSRMQWHDAKGLYRTGQLVIVRRTTNWIMAVMPM